MRRFLITFSAICVAVATLVRIYTRDLQGNIRAVTDLAGNLLQTNHYYPYGMPFGEAVAPQLPRFGSDVQSYRFSGHRYIQTSGLNLCDFPARPYNPATANFWGPDSNSDNYPHLSPWLYCAANPINAIDPQGELIIFINGMHFDNSGGKSKYWDGVDKRAMQVLHDNHAIYIDGSFGGLNSLSSNIAPKERYKEGYYKGKEMGLAILDNLEPDENIYIVTHSMGAVFAKGFIAGADLATRGNVSSFSQNVVAEIDLAPYNSNSKYQRASKNVPTIAVHHENDIFAGKKESQGCLDLCLSGNSNNPFKCHSIKSFADQLQLIWDAIKLAFPTIVRLE